MTEQLLNLIDNLEVVDVFGHRVCEYALSTESEYAFIGVLGAQAMYSGLVDAWAQKRGADQAVMRQ